MKWHKKWKQLAGCMAVLAAATHIAPAAQPARPTSAHKAQKNQPKRSAAEPEHISAYMLQAQAALAKPLHARPAVLTRKTVTVTERTLPGNAAEPKQINILKETIQHEATAVQQPMNLIGQNMSTEDLSASVLLSEKIMQNNPTVPINPVMVNEALTAWHWAQKHGNLDNTHCITMVDFSMPSDCKRLYVIDTQSGKILINTYVAHGSGSGTRLPTVFSNEEESHQSSLGAMVIGKTYHGKHGLSLHLAGLEPGINNNVAARSIVMHSASYVTPSYIQAHHSAGRSWGCFAVGPSMLPILIPMLQGGSMLFAYAPAEQQDQNFNR